MPSEILSTAVPTRLRLAGFSFIVVGVLAVGMGSTRGWVAVGFAADAEHAIDVPVVGTDVWEGKVVLFAAIATLLVLVAMRLATSGATRRVLAIVLIVLGAVCVVLPIVDAVRVKDRFGGGEGLDRIAAELAIQLALPEDVVREQLTEQFERDLRVKIGPGMWLCVTGGVLLIVGGALSLAWSRRPEGIPDPAG